MADHFWANDGLLASASEAAAVYEAAKSGARTLNRRLPHFRARRQPPQRSCPRSPQTTHLYNMRHNVGVKPSRPFFQVFDHPTEGFTGLAAQQI